MLLVELILRIPPDGQDRFLQDGRHLGLHDFGRGSRPGGGYIYLGKFLLRGQFQRDVKQGIKTERQQG